MTNSRTQNQLMKKNFDLLSQECEEFEVNDESVDLTPVKNTLQLKNVLSERNSKSRRKLLSPDSDEDSPVTNTRSVGSSKSNHFTQSDCAKSSKQVSGVKSTFSKEKESKQSRRCSAWWEDDDKMWNFHSLRLVPSSEILKEMLQNIC